MQTFIQHYYPTRGHVTLDALIDVYIGTVLRVRGIIILACSSLLALSWDVISYIIAGYLV